MAQQRTTATDPDFLATYGSTSRLAFLGGKRDEIWQEVFDTNAREVTPPRPPTNGRQRVVFHIDMDCFFAWVAILANPSLRGKPVAVCHSSGPSSNSEISSCNYEARKYGVGASMWLQEARRKCPSLVAACVEINQCVKRVLLAPSSGEESSPPRRRAGVASMAWRSTRRFPHRSQRPTTSTPIRRRPCGPTPASST